jgi:hypothetical protein
MISLLVTFFVMLMSFSTSSKGDIKSAGVGILKGRGGVFPNLTGYPRETRLRSRSSTPSPAPSKPSAAWAGSKTRWP